MDDIYDGVDVKCLVYVIKKNTETQLDASKEGCLEREESILHKCSCLSTVIQAKMLV